jgi:acetoin utilization deacetylase AcuC-like enzyme
MVQYTMLNVPLPAGAGDAEIIRAFQERLLPAAERFHPEFVLVAAGFDAHRHDSLAQLQVTGAGYATLTRMGMEMATRFVGGRLGSVLEGG